jgi:hypothetical protein
MKKLLILLLPVTLLFSFQSYRKDLSHGKNLFTANCSMCHRPTRPLVGPPLQYIRKDLDANWVFAFIRNHDSFAKSGDVRAQYTYTIWHKTIVKETYNHLSNDDLNAMLDYIDTFSSYNPTYYAHRKLSEIQIRSMLHSIDTMKFEDPLKRMDFLDSLAGH